MRCAWGWGSFALCVSSRIFKFSLICGLFIRFGRLFVMGCDGVSVLLPESCLEFLSRMLGLTPNCFEWGDVFFQVRKWFSGMRSTDIIPVILVRARSRGASRWRWLESMAIFEVCQGRCDLDIMLDDLCLSVRPNQKILTDAFVLWSHSVGSVSISGSNPPSVVTSILKLYYLLWLHN